LGYNTTRKSISAFFFALVGIGNIKRVAPENTRPPTLLEQAPLIPCGMSSILVTFVQETVLHRALFFHTLFDENKLEQRKQYVTFEKPKNLMKIAAIFL